MISKFRLSCDRLSKKTTLLHDASHEIDRLLSVSSLNCDCLSVCNDARCLTCDLTSESTAEAKGSLKRKAHRAGSIPFTCRTFKRPPGLLDKAPPASSTAQAANAWSNLFDLAKAFSQLVTT